MDTEAKVQKVLDEIRPYLQADGGDAEFVRMENNVVYLKLKGACHGCPSAQITLKMGIERRMRAEIPEVESVEAV